MAIDQEEGEPSKAAGKNNKKILIIVGVVVGVLILLSIVGTLAAGYVFNKAVETGFEAATGGQLDVDTNGNGELAFESKDGQTTFQTGTEIPEGFPVAVPVYEDAKVVSSSSNASNGGKLYSVTLTSQDSPQQVFAFYKQTFASNGWKTLSTLNNGGIANVSAGHAAKQLYGRATVSTNSDGVTAVQIGAKTNFQTNQ